MKFKTIVADPPWRYLNGGCWDRRSSRASTRYDTLSIDDICDLPVQSVVADDAYLWLWITNRHIIHGYGAKVARAWGFEPITTRVWCKPQMGLGYYIRNAHENIVFARRGTPGQFKYTDMLSWFIEDRQQHSTKPNSCFDEIMQYCPAPYLELFARDTRLGWISWGDEVGDPFDWTFDPENWRK